MTPTQSTIKPQKVMLVITKSNWGGAQKYVFDVAKTLQEDGYSVSVACGGTGEMTKRLHALQIPIHQLKALRNDMNLLTVIPSLRELVSLFRKERVDVIHLNSSKIGLFGAFAGRIAGIKHIVFTAHSWPFNEERSGLQKLFLRSLMQVTVFLSHITICNSKSTLATLQAPSFISKRCIVIHNGVAPIAFKEPGAFFVERNLPHPSRTTLFSIGELHTSKGFDLALEYLAHLKDLEWEWHIAGEGKERKALEKQIQDLGLEDRVFLHGHVYGAPYINSFDIFFFPSRTEGLGYVAIEALQSSLPIIASNAGGIPEVLGKDPGTTFITIRDTSSQDVLRKTLSNPLPKIVNTDRQKLREQFSLRHMVTEIEKVYRAS